MAQKPETVFTNSVHKHLPGDEDVVYKVKTHNPYAGGIPDWYYDGEHSDLWAEYKFHKGPFPKILNLCDPKKLYALSSLQQRWLNRREKNGGNAIVVFGCKDGVLILQHGQWNDIHEGSIASAQLFTRKEAAEWITNYVASPGRKR